MMQQGRMPFTRSVHANVRINRTAHTLQQHGNCNRLFQHVDRASLHRADGGSYASVSRDHDCRQGDISTDKPLLQFQPTHTGQLLIKDQTSGLRRSKLFDEGFRAWVGGSVQAVPVKSGPEGFASIGVVVNDEYSVSNG
jgi:hypothetical protein